MKRILTALLALSMLLPTGCAKKTDAPPAESPAEPAPIVEPAAPEPAAEPEPPAEEPIPVSEFHGLKVPIPQEYLELLVIDPEPETWSAHRTPLVSFSERASVEAGQADRHDEDWGDGFLCTVSTLDRIGFEDWLSGGGSDMGEYVFARDGEETYYLISYPTDVRLYRVGGIDGTFTEIEGLDEWRMLNEWADALPDELVAANALTAYDASDLLNADYTYGGTHVELACRFPGEPMDLCVFSLSQPAKQGEGGVWCVERVQFIYSDYNFTDLQLVFPVALGFDEAAADYYARLQAECDAGEHPALLTPRGAALDYAKRSVWIFGEDISETDFELIEAVG